MTTVAASRINNPNWQQQARAYVVVVVVVAKKETEIGFVHFVRACVRRSPVQRAKMSSRNPFLTNNPSLQIVQ